MDVKFDSLAAEQLIRSMLKYCRGIEQDTRDLLDIMNHTDNWKDNQSKAFNNNVYALAEDLDKILALEGDYMRTFYERVQELKG